MTGTTWRALLLLGVVLTAQLCPCTAYVGGGFSVEFIHRDSPKSPLHDPSLTSHDRVLAAVRRSTERSYTVGDPSGGVAEIRSSPYEYLIYVNIGTPRTRMLAIVNTGSNLVSFKCINGTSGPPPAAGGSPLSYVFDTSSSSSYGFVACRLPSCHAVRGASCDANSHCQYHFSSGDGSTTDGILSTETFIFDDAPGGCVGCRERPQLQLTRVNFGCNTNTTGGSPFLLTGNVGLGAGNLSLIDQIGTQTSLGRRFSYCLAPFSINASSIINFGARATVKEPGAVTTPLIPSAVDAFYTILLTSVKIGSSTIVPPKRSPVVVDWHGTDVPRQGAAGPDRGGAHQEHQAPAEAVAGEAAGPVLRGGRYDSGLGAGEAFPGGDAGVWRRRRDHPEGEERVRTAAAGDRVLGHVRGDGQCGGHR
ncbi:aspartic proteinase CDR1 isoform X1 [Triticum aestivum]|uniref:Peptidase A1 domain-containing protein n=1 Tax=Aegilops tauschii subsp. strangulata TaxID=200361 RepID=A0A453E9G9_AEGTS|nr:aspartic proteinase CDR1-like isoform X1 [Triticum aestivum]XP_045090606.1 aspartic proteinase CDR1-like [Aegilops tauschii subsp. strangulata]XP_045090607.1 aspartic proteinase CDR1-like [Aegilops tauschii subsp. strangulata]XP_045090608.1 aspartic proteinase CDR1-like [Aegilops tauschii subsp. strangulata]XP_045090609.1 aspartic proteinase CDR1-like [Aegilops tauschii subsp. strangulata]